jgi:hypothetical protein
VGLPAQFLWASQQALENYLKCILFIRRISATQLKHDLTPALALMETHDVWHAPDRAESNPSRPHRRRRTLLLHGASFFVEWRWIVSLD